MGADMRALFILTLLLLAAALPARAELRVFACEPEWGALAQELGGDKVSVYTATTALQDPHRVQARPSLIARLRRAGLLVCTGAQLEIGWLPALLRRAANAAVQPGNAGYFAAADYVVMREVPQQIDRIAGDVHPEGNPHIHTDPRNIARVAKALAERMVRLDPDHRAFYQGRLAGFSARWKAAIERWEAQAQRLRGVPVVTQHRSWVYLIHWLGLREVATLEAKPGIPPSSAHLAQVVSRLARSPAKMVIRAAYQDTRPSRWLSARAPLAEVVLPYTVGGTPEAKDLFGLFDDTVRRLQAAAR